MHSHNVEWPPKYNNFILKQEFLFDIYSKNFLEFAISQVMENMESNISNKHFYFILLALSSWHQVTEKRISRLKMIKLNISTEVIYCIQNFLKQSHCCWYDQTNSVSVQLQKPTHWLVWVCSISDCDMHLHDNITFGMQLQLFSFVSL